MPKNRPQRPGTQPTTTAPKRGGGGGGGGNNRNKNRPNSRGGGGGSNKNKNKGEKPIAPLDPNSLPSLPLGSNFDRNADYGYTGDKPYYETDTGRIDATDNPEKLYAYLDSMAGFGGQTASPFALWRQTQGQQQFLNALNNAQRINPDLNPVDFASGLGGNISGPSTTQPVPMGTGQPINTGNPFTSSSGIGGGAASPLPLVKPMNPLQRGGPSGPKPLTPRINPLNPGGTRPNLPNGPGGGDAPLDWNLRQRFDFLKLAPEQRGEPVQGAMQMPGRWSPWG